MSFNCVKTLEIYLLYKYVCFKVYISLYTNLIKIFSSLSFNILFNSSVLIDIPKISLFKVKEDSPDVLATAWYIYTSVPNFKSISLVKYDCA